MLLGGSPSFLVRAMAHDKHDAGAIFQEKQDPPKLPPIPKSTGGHVAGKKTSLVSNCFRLQLNADAAIHHYHYSLTPAAKDAKEEKWVLQQAWKDLKQQLGVFVVRCPEHIFSPKKLDADQVWDIVGDEKLGYEKRQLALKYYEGFAALQVNSGVMGKAEVVTQHILKRLAQPKRYNRVGRRFFNIAETFDKVITGFLASMCALSKSGPLLQLDLTFRAVSKKNVIDMINLSLDADAPEASAAMRLTDPEVRGEWLRRCVNSTVITSYNNRIYQVKAVHFDKSPSSNFRMFVRETKSYQELTFAAYYNAYYSRQITEPKQPLLEAYAEKESEQVFLVPEFCSLTGLSDELRKDKALVTESLKQMKVQPAERLNATLNLAAELLSGLPPSAPETDGAQALRNVVDGDGVKVLKEWNFTLERQPIEVEEARVFEPLEVGFGAKRYAIEEGNFQRWMRNGLQCPVRVDDWLFLYPETDAPVLDIWLRSLREIAQVAFTMRMAEPARQMCSLETDELLKALKTHVKPTTQLVLLLIPQKDSRRVYNVFKKATATEIPCVTQVVKSETIRKRQSIASVLSRIVLQINAKFNGPLWSIDLCVESLKPLFQNPTMVIGIDIFLNHEGVRYMGFAASLDTNCSEYYSTACTLDGEGARAQSSSEVTEWRSTLSTKIQEALRDALVAFAKRNDFYLPEHVIVYRANTCSEEFQAILSLEAEGIKEVLKAAVSSDLRKGYDPQLTFIAIARHGGPRFFCQSAGGMKNPDPGTVVECTSIARQDAVNFYLINQTVSKGTASPTHYTVLEDGASLSPHLLQNLTHRLSFLYFNHTGAVKLPAPAQYARKIATLVGSAVQAEPHRRLRTCLFYL